MSKAIRIYKSGGPEVLEFEDIGEIGDPGPNEVVIEQMFAGLNLVDTYHRAGLYKKTFPFTPGVEAAGVVKRIGENVKDLREGDLVTYVSFGLGAYAEERVIDANYVLKIPDAISAEQAAASLHKGMTAEYILNNPFTSVETNFIKPGTNVMLYAAAGGVGHIACQWAKDMGANVIGVVSTEEKAEFAKAHGCAHTILFNKKSNEQDFIRAVMDKTGGEGVPIIYDSVGRDTFGMSLKCLPKSGGGLLVSYGNASGPLPSVNFLEIEGSPAIVRPKLIDYIESLERRRASAHSFLDMVASGKIKIEINQRYSLDNAAQAQRELGNRETTGSSVLTMAPEY